MARDYESVVKAMLAKAASLPEGEPERIALEERAFTIMSERQIKVALDKSDEDKQVHMVLEFESPYPYQKMTLYNIIGKHFNLSILKTDRVTCHVFGYRSDYDSTEFLYAILFNQAMSTLASLPIPPGVNAKTYRTSWFIGFSNKINERLREAKKSAARESSEPGAALVLMDRSKIAEAKRAEKFKHVTSGSRSHANAYEAYTSGQAAGERAKLHDGTGVSSSKREIGR